MPFEISVNDVKQNRNQNILHLLEERYIRYFGIWVFQSKYGKKNLLKFWYQLKMVFMILILYYLGIFWCTEVVEVSNSANASLRIFIFGVHKFVSFRKDER